MAGDREPVGVARPSPRSPRMAPRSAMRPISKTGWSSPRLATISSRRQQFPRSISPPDRPQPHSFSATTPANRPLAGPARKSSCNAGTTSAAFKAAVIDRVAFYRAMAGVPSSIGLAATYSTANQQAALMFSRNNQLSHTPPSSWACYSAAGAQAAGSSNIALGNVWHRRHRRLYERRRQQQRRRRTPALDSSTRKPNRSAPATFPPAAATPRPTRSGFGTRTSAARGPAPATGMSPGLRRATFPIRSSSRAGPFPIPAPASAAHR